VCLTAAFEIKRKAARADVTKYPAVSTPNRHRRRRPMDIHIIYQREFWRTHVACPASRLE